MGNLVLSLIVDCFMAILLCVTIYYCWKLNQRIRVLQDSRSELARIIREFDESTRRATASIGEIHEATKRISDNIQHKIDKANFLADDLQYMIERGSKIAGPGREASAPPARPARAEAPQPARSPAAPAAASLPPRDLGRVHNLDTNDLAAVSPAAARGPSRNRSRAELELLNVLKTREESGR